MNPKGDEALAYMEKITPVGVLVGGVMHSTTLSELDDFLAALRGRRR